MASKGYSLDSVIAGAEKVIAMWEDNPTFSLGEITLDKLKAMVTELKALRTQRDDLRTQLSEVTNDIDRKRSDVNAAVTRAVSGTRAIFGPDSNQYERVGGTRTSDRKRPVRKKNGGGGTPGA